jgi:AcrR family transcriptional regulator
MDSRQASRHELRWIRPPRQVRSQETLDRILDAAEALLTDKGFEDVKVADVVARADSSVGAFYARFHDKDGLLFALQQRWRDQAIATTDDALDPERWAREGIAEILRSVVPFLVGTFRERKGLMRAFVLRHYTDAAFREQRDRLTDYVADKLAALLLARQGEITHPDPELAARFGLGLVFDGIQSAVLFDEPRGTPLGDARLAAELTRAYLAYLGVPDHPESPPSPRAS